jgi:hypothetical protein
MKPPKIDAVWKYAHRCFLNQRDNPQIQDLLYCSLMFLREAMKASFGQRPQSSGRIALELAASRSKRLRLYQRLSPVNLVPAKLPLAGRNHRNHV